MEALAPENRKIQATVNLPHRNREGRRIATPLTVSMKNSGRGSAPRDPTDTLLPGALEMKRYLTPTINFAVARSSDASDPSAR